MTVTSTPSAHLCVVRLIYDTDVFRYNSGDYEGEKARASYYTTRMKLPGDNLGGSPTQINISNRALNEILKNTDIDLAAFEETVSSTMKSGSKAIKGSLLKLKTSVDSKLVKARNVVGVILFRVIGLNIVQSAID